MTPICLREQFIWPASTAKNIAINYAYNFYISLFNSTY